MICARCGKSSNVSIVSMFDVSEICLDCKSEEEKHPKYSEARAAEEAACRRGDFNFRGIGWPGKDKS